MFENRRVWQFLGDLWLILVQKRNGKLWFEYLVWLWGYVFC